MKSKRKFKVLAGLRSQIIGLESQYKRTTTIHFQAEMVRNIVRGYHKKFIKNESVTSESAQISKVQSKRKRFKLDAQKNAECWKMLNAKCEKF